MNETQDTLNGLTEKMKEFAPDGFKRSIFETHPYTQHAIEIAEIALCAFTGQLLRKALNVAAAITEFEDELNGGKSQRLGNQEVNHARN